MRSINSIIGIIVCLMVFGLASGMAYAKDSLNDALIGSLSEADKVLYEEVETGADRIRLTCIRYVYNMASSLMANGSEEFPYHSITAALAASPEGCTIRVLPGYYSASDGETFPLTLKPEMTLEGYDDGVLRIYDRTIIHGGGTLDLEDHPDRNVTIVGADGAAVRNLTIETVSNNHDGNNGIGILCSDGHMTIAENSFTGTGYEGILVWDTGEADIYENVFSGEQLDWGIACRTGSAPFIYDNSFACLNGIDITSTSEAEVSDNDLTCERAGIQIQEAAAPLVADNTITGHAECGIRVVGSHGAAPTPLIEGNTIEDNGSGLEWDGGVVLFGDVMPDLGGGEQGSSGHNTFYNNNGWDLVNRSVNTIYARNNTWSHSRSGAYVFDPYVDVDEEDIYDDDEDPFFGAVLYDRPLMFYLMSR